MGVSRLGDHHTSSQVLTEAKLIKKQSTEHKMGGGGYQALTMEYGKREIQGEGTVKKGGLRLMRKETRQQQEKSRLWRMV